MSDFRLQIIHAKDGVVATWLPGLPIEVDLVEELCVRLKKKGVGWFTPEAKVLAAVKMELASVIFDLKRKVK